MKRLLLLVLAISTVQAAFNCTTMSGVVPADLNQTCAECEFKATISPLTGACQAEITNPNDVSTLGRSLAVSSNCSSEFDECQSSNGTCVGSKYGVLCRECAEQGYLIWSDDLTYRKCKCYTNQLDPARNCQPGLFYTPTYQTNVVQRTYVKFSCEAHNSTQLGCYEPVDDQHHKYGEPNPPIPYRCCEPWLGPPPGELIGSIP